MDIIKAGQICFGIAFTEGIEFPWDRDGYNGNIDNWWVYSVLEFHPSFELYDIKGDFLEGMKPPQEKMDAYWQERYDFKKQTRPLPVQLINYCNSEYPHWILAIPSSIVVAYECEPVAFNPSGLKVTKKAKEDLINFCRQHGIDFEEEPKWWLSSYWDY